MELSFPSFDCGGAMEAKDPVVDDVDGGGGLFGGGMLYSWLLLLIALLLMLMALVALVDDGGGGSGADLGLRWGGCEWWDGAGGGGS